MVDIVRLGQANSQVNKVSERPAARSESKAKESSSSSSSSSDRVEISSGAKEFSVVQRLTSIAEAEPEVRAEAVARAKEKLTNGEYNGVEVSRQAAKNILGIS